MIEKALIVIVFMYAMSFSLLGGQYIMDVFGVTMVTQDGTEVHLPTECDRSGQHSVRSKTAPRMACTPCPIRSSVV